MSKTKHTWAAGARAQALGEGGTEALRHHSLEAEGRTPPVRSQR